MILAELTSDLVGKSYKLGDVDCARLILEVAKRSGIPLSEEWEGFTPENYAELYERDPEEAQQVLICWVTSIGTEIPGCKAFAGDVLIARTINGSVLSVLLHAGQDQAMIVNEKRGVTMVPLRAYEIVKAFRWRPKRRRRIR